MINLVLDFNRARTLFRALAATLAGTIFLFISPLVPVVQAATVTPCSDDEVTVMVEGYPLTCATPGGNGWQTLANAGFTVEGTQKFPEFICRINNYPGADVDKCLTASPTHAYWTYWHAPLGGNSWEYSNLGSLLYQPQAGTVEAWTWGPGLEPGPIPVSRTEVEKPSDPDPVTEPTFDANPNLDTDDTEGGSGLIIPTFPTIAPLPTQNSTTAVPEPEENPENPNEVLVFLDAEGNRISREDYENLVTAASQPAPVPAQARTAPPVNTQPAPQPASSTTATPDPKSTRVMSAPAIDNAEPSQAKLASPQYTATTTAQSPGSSSQTWMIAVTIAFTVLLGGAAAATWVIRRGEING